MVERELWESYSILVADDANAQPRPELSPACSSHGGERTRYSGGTSTGSSFTSLVAGMEVEAYAWWGWARSCTPMLDVPDDDSASSWTRWHGVHIATTMVTTAATTTPRKAAAATLHHDR